MEDLYQFYANESKRFFGEKPESEIPETDQVWDRWRTLLDECKDRMFGNYTEDELFNPQSPGEGLYSKVAALYEVCYTKAKEQRSLDYKQRQIESSGGGGSGGSGGSSSGGNSSGGGGSSSSSRSSGGSSASDDRSPGDARIKFPWRMAAHWLNEMKRSTIKVAAEKARRAR